MDNELTLYAILYQIVKGWPATYHSTGPEERFKRLNTFAVVEDEAQVFADNLGKDSRYKPTESGQQFYSRTWSDAGFRDEELQKELPALLVWEEPGELRQPLTEQEHEVLRLRVCIQGRHVAAYAPGAGTDYGKGTQRTVEEVKANLRLLRQQFHAELRQWVRVEANHTSNGWQTIWVNEGHLATLVPGTYTEWRNKRPITAYIKMENQEALVLANVDANGQVHAYSSLEVLLEPCSPVAIDHTATEPLEVLDHPTKASA